MKKSLLDDLANLVKQLPFKNIAQKDYLILKTKMSIISIYGHDSSYLRELESISFLPSYDYFGAYDVAWNQGHDQLTQLITVMTEHTLIKEKSDIQFNNLKYTFKSTLKNSKDSTIKWFLIEYFLTNIFDYIFK